VSPGPHANADLLGKRVAEWEIVSCLGGGGMGVVYEGKASDGSRVAVKTLKPAFANDTELVGRFLGEARALKAISHRAMVDILSIGKLDDGTHYMVMEFLEGRTFEDVIKRGAPLDVREVMTWMVEVLDALETVHAAGVIHRDLKPSNLFLARTGVGPQVKLIDFGIAKHTGSSGKGAPKTLVSAIVGTPDYMSPEQVNGADVTAASDLYALGCVMYEMVTGKVPFGEESSVKKMLMHVERPAPRASKLQKTLPKGVDDLIAWTMSKSPGERPPNARALKERILDVMSEELGGSGPAVTMQLRAVKATSPNDEPTALADFGPARTEPSMPAVVDPREPSPVRVRRSTEPGRRRKYVRVPAWALAIGAVGLLIGILAVVWKLTRPAGEPAPAAELGAPSDLDDADPDGDGPEVEPAPKAPPDHPIPKRKKPFPPARKKAPGGKRR
jgi:hypothetical protein